MKFALNDQFYELVNIKNSYLNSKSTLQGYLSNIKNSLRKNIVCFVVKHCFQRIRKYAIKCCLLRNKIF